MRRLVLLAAALVLAACSEIGPPGPGTLTVTLDSPNGSEGAAVLMVLGEGIGEVSSVGETEAHAVVSGGVTRVVLINQTGGTLAFQVAVNEVRSRPTVILGEVAGPDDELRADLSGYRVELTR